MLRCSECPCEHDPVPPDRIGPCDYLIFGEKPGKDEDRLHKPFCGKTGRELNEGYLPMLGWSRDRVGTVTVTATNAIKCWFGPGAKDKLDLNKQSHRDILDSCTRQHLYKEIKQAKAKLLIPMGVPACKAIDPDIDLELQHGIPLQTSFGMAFPMYHPASGLHEPKRMLHIRTDWDRLRKYIRGKLYLPVDPFAGREDYRCLEKPSEIRASLRGRQHLALACDTEIKKHNRQDPFCITYSTEPGRAHLIRADNKKGLAAFQDEVSCWEGRILWHNWLFDADVCDALGLEFNRKLITDTLRQVFHLQNMPLGLKALSYRELGMAMQDFDDVVTPYSRERCLDYLRYASMFTWPKPEEKLVRDDATGGWKLYKPQGMGTKLKRFFTDFEKNPEGKDIFESWKNWKDHQEMIQKECGEWPGKCISHVPFDEALFYACRDADSLGRLAPRIRQMQRRVRRTSPENWRDMA